MSRLRNLLVHWRSAVIVSVPLLLLPLALQESKEARCGYVVCVMALFWMTEALPLPVTSLFPIVLFPFLGVLPTDDICKSYFKEPNMMFVGGLIIAIAVEHCNLHKRIALRVMIAIGSSPRRLLFGFMMTTMFLSMWISNTATTAMMVPIVAAVLDELKTHEQDQARRPSLSQCAGVAKSRHDSGTFDEETRRKSCARIDVSHLSRPTREEVTYFLGIAYAANIGGTGTLTGTGTNLTFRGLFEGTFPKADGINFASWMAFNVPLMLINCIFAWLWLQFLFQGLLSRKGSKQGEEEERKLMEKEKGVRDLMQSSYDKLGPMTYHEGSVLAIFVVIVFLWFFRKPEFMPGWGNLHENVAIDDASAAILGVVLLFILPANLDFLKKGPRNKKSCPSLLNWKTVHEKVPWGLVLLSGGGFAMAEATKESGLSTYLGQQLVALKVLPPFVMLIVVCLGTTFVTEVSSNTAIANIVLPVLAQMCVAIETNPLYLMMPATICCSYAFMLPVATPPNAIVVAASNMKTRDMMKAGFGLNMICVATLIICLKTFGMYLYGLEEFPQFAIDYIISHNFTTPHYNGTALFFNASSTA